MPRSPIAILALLVCLLAPRPAEAQVTSDAIGYIDSPASGATFNRQMGAPHVLVSFQASGLKVSIAGAAALQLFSVQVSFDLNYNGNPLDWDWPAPFIAQADGNGEWSYEAKGTGQLQRLGYGVGPGNHTASIMCDLAVSAGGAPNANYPHSHPFTVN